MCRLANLVALAAISLSAIIVSPTSAQASSGECTANVAWTGGCTTNTTSVDITGTWTTEDDNHTDTVTDTTHDPTVDTDSDTTTRIRTVQDFDECLTSWDSYTKCFRDITDEEDPEDPTAPDPPPIPEITLTDVARFAPAAVPIGAEPGNAGIAGMATNFVAAASVQTSSGTIFGLPVSVRFTPVAYDYDFGDGTSASFTTAGVSWQELGQAQFTSTPTSHVYAERGTYTATLSIRYAAEVDLGGGWFPLSGQLSIASGPQEIRIFEAHTALVARTCGESPGAPGC